MRQAQEKDTSISGVRTKEIEDRKAFVQEQIDILCKRMPASPHELDQMRQGEATPEGAPTSASD